MFPLIYLLAKNILKYDLLGIPDTSLSGRKTLTALSVRKSKSGPTMVRILLRTHINDTVYDRVYE